MTECALYTLQPHDETIQLVTTWATPAGFSDVRHESEPLSPGSRPPRSRRAADHWSLLINEES